MGRRQNDRYVDQLLTGVEKILGSTPLSPDDAFRTLIQSKIFKAKYGGDLEFQYTQEDTMQHSLVELYKLCVKQNDTVRANDVLALYSPFRTRAVTMIVFGCSESAVKRANFTARMRHIPKNTNQIEMKRSLVPWGRILLGSLCL